MNGLEEVLSEMLTDLKWFVAFMAVAMALSGTRSMLAQGGRIDDDRAAAAGIRKLTSQHLTLYTDVPQGQDVDEFPGVFDLAVPQWCRYFDLDPARARDWRMTGFVMRDRARFQDAGLLPADLPKFPNGYQRGANFWLYDQKDAYYRRHLFLHEGTHAFMDRVAGGMGPPWYAEGLAELLGTHRWQNGTLTLGYLPKDKLEAPGWGRVRIVKDQIAAGQDLSPDQILAYGPTAHLRNEPYGWCWALAVFLDEHPRYQQRFRGLRQLVRGGELTARFRQQMQDDWADFCEEWQVFVMNIDYGYDVARAAIQRRPAAPLPATGATVTIAADRGWQSAGVRLESGATYRLEASGRYQVAQATQPWWCEPRGVTIHYHQGLPLGQLLGAIRDESRPLSGLTPLVHPEAVGHARDWTVAEGGTLYLKINESAAHLADNQGQITVRINRK